MGKYVVKKTKNDGFMFNLLATNGQVIATSEIYNSLDSCKKGIQSVANNAAIANFEDHTIEDYEKAVNPKFEMYTDKAGETRFRLKARNGEVIAASQGYKSKSSCLNGIESVRKNGVEPTIEMEEV